MKSGLMVSIYKSEGMSFDGKAGFSSKTDKVVILPSKDFPDVPGIFEPTADMPAVVVVKRNVCGKEYLTAYPSDNEGKVDGSVWRMFGGCYISCCDSRFPADYPIPLHDRIE